MQFLENPFFVLEVSPQSTADTINYLYDDVLLDGTYNEQVVSVSHKSLTVSKERLRAELQWVHGLSEHDFRCFISCLKHNDYEGLAKFSDKLKGLSLMNLSAFLCKQGCGKEETLDAFFEGLEGYDIPDIMEIINGARSASGFPAVNELMVQAVIKELTQQYVETVFSFITSTSSPSIILAKYLKNHSNVVLHSEIVAELIGRYKNFIASNAASYKEQIEGMFIKIFHIPRVKAFRIKPEITSLVKLVEQRQLIIAPITIYMARKGLNEPETEELLKLLHSLSVWLANKRKAYGTAHLLARCNAECFQYLPAAQEIIGSAVNDLEKLWDKKLYSNLKTFGILVLLAIGYFYDMQDKKYEFSNNIKNTSAVCQKPDPDSNATLTIPEIRWLLFNLKKLEYIYDAIQQQKANETETQLACASTDNVAQLYVRMFGEIEKFKNRNYRKRNGEKVEREVKDNAKLLRKEANQLIERANQGYTDF